MEISWLARLNTVDLQCSAERDQMHYLAHDRVTGKIYRISAEIARAVNYCKQIASNADRDNLDKEHLKAAYGFLGSLQSMHKTELSRRPPFNPLFINIELFDVGPFQPRLQTLANFWVGSNYWIILTALTITAFWLGSWSDWQILAVFKNIFSLNAIATFAIIAPFLKIIHELGHTLVATKFGVRVRKTGLYLIGLYPMPYVDCTDADLSATRIQRIAISLAGLFTDILVALSAFIAWHFVEGDFLKTLLANVFMFSSVNSVLFNANPLIKLDGYYALADWLGIRNMYTEASKNFRGIRRKVMTFGKDGAFPQTRRARLLSLYSFASVLYKTNMILGILWIILPKYFGLGSILAVWGGYMMFVSPMVGGASIPADKKKAGTGLFWILLIAGIGAALVFVKVPFRVVLPVFADIENHYSVQSQSSGFIKTRQDEGFVNAGQVILQLSNPDLQSARSLHENQLAMAQYTYDAISGVDPAGALVANERLRAAKLRLELTTTRIANLEVLATKAGYYAPDYTQIIGDFVSDGGTIGAVYPNTQTVYLAGNFPERYVEKFQNTTPTSELRINGEYRPLTDVETLNLIQTVSMDRETGARSYQLTMRVRDNPTVVNSANMQVKVSFPKEPLYRHVQFLVAALVQKFREAKLRQN